MRLDAVAQFEVVSGHEIVLIMGLDPGGAMTNPVAAVFDPDVAALPPSGPPGILDQPGAFFALVVVPTDNEDAVIYPPVCTFVKNAPFVILERRGRVDGDGQ